MARTNDVTYLPGLAQLMAGRKINYVAEALEIDQSTLSLLIQRKRGASLAMARRLARYFGTTVEELCQEQTSLAA